MDKVLPQQRQMTSEERKRLAATKIKMDVTPFEAEILKQLRLMDYGKFTIHMQDNIPFRFTTEQSSIVFAGTDGFDTLSKVKQVVAPL